MVKVLIADDHQIVRSGIRMIIESDPGFTVVGEAADGSQALTMTLQEKPDVVLLDISMPPGMSGIATCENICRDCPGTKVIMLTMYADLEYLYATLRGGAMGYVLKNAAPEDLLEAVHSVAEGGSYIHADMRDLLQRHIEEGHASVGDDLGKLTTRELEVLQFLARGYTNKEISEKVFLSVKTIEAHRAKIYAKLGFSSRADLVDFALRHNLLK